ncbi:MAG: hypothetical protein K0R57_4819 [Paenibacillaceae bacterium]|jgi:hypothetical protein|nr:hypothetical protein [Paenibacillaceae bacterium]
MKRIRASLIISATAILTTILFLSTHVQAVTVTGTKIKEVTTPSSMPIPSIKASSSTPSVMSTVSLSDISGHWAKSDIEEAVKAGYVTGYENGTFQPDAPINKNEFLSMLIRALKTPINSVRSGEAWFTPIYDAAVKNKIYQDDYKGEWTESITRGEMAVTLERATRQRSHTIDKNKLVAEISSQKKEEIDFTYILNLYPYPEYKDDRLFLESQEGFSIDLGQFNQPQKLYSELLEWYTVKKREQFVQENKAEGRLYCSPEYAKSNSNQNCANKNDQLIEPYFKRYLNFVYKFIKPTEDQKAANNAILTTIDVKYADLKDPKQMIYEATRRGLMTGTNIGELSLDTTTTRAQAVVVIKRVLAFNQGDSLETDKYAQSQAEINWHRSNIITMLPQYFGQSAYSTYAESPFKEESLRFKDDLMETASNDGNAWCKANRLIIIDGDDSNDPYRYLIPSDIEWVDFENRELKPISGSNYFIYSDYSMHVAQFPEGFRGLYGCSVNVSFPSISYSYKSTLFTIQSENEKLKNEDKPYTYSYLDNYMNPDAPEIGYLKYSNASILRGNPGEEITHNFFRISLLPKGPLTINEKKVPSENIRDRQYNNPKISFIGMRDYGSNQTRVNGSTEIYVGKTDPLK